MSEQLNEMSVLKVNQDYIDRLDKRVKKIKDRLYSYRWQWEEKVYIHKTTNRKISREKYDELQKQYRTANQKLYDTVRRERNKSTSTVIDYASSFIVMDKRQNPSLYPDWLSFNFPDVKKNTSRSDPYSITPTIDLEKALQTDGNWARTTNIIDNRLNSFFRRYFPQEASIVIKRHVISGIESYIKNVFRKEIRKRIKDLDTHNCIHSIVFRVRKSYNSEVQIHPRWRDIHPCYTYSVQREIENEMKKILSEYGWKEGVNYSSSTQRD